MKKGMVSITIPVYNRAEYLEECLESIYKQSYQNFEIIIVDDGSTDNTLDIATKLAQKDSRVKLKATSHQGVSNARNVTLEMVEGEFVFFIDSDDIIHPLLLETLVTALNNTDASIAGTYAPCINEKYWDKVKTSIANDKGPGQTTYQNHEESLRAVLKTNSPLGNIGGVMIKTELIGETRFNPDVFIGEDFYFIYQNLIKGASTIFLKQKWYKARWHTNNTSNDYTFTGFLTRFYRRKIVWESEEKFGRKEYANLQKRQAFSCYTALLKNKPVKEDIKKMQKVIKEHKRELLGAMNIKLKVSLYLSLYFPRIYLLIENIIHKTYKFLKKLFAIVR